MSDFLNKLFGFDGQVVVVIGGTGVLGGELCTVLPKPAQRSSSPAAVPNAARSELPKSKASAARPRFVAEVDAANRESVKELLDSVRCNTATSPAL